MPMLIAVSCLSPVIIQTRMPPSIRVSIASGTPSCSLSSMAVTPSSSICTSSCSAAAAMRASRSSSEEAACSYFRCHASHSPASSTLVAMTRVRRPFTEKACRFSCVSASSFSSVPARSRGSITASEPLHSSLMVPSGERATTDMRARSELNSNSTSTSCVTRCPWKLMVIWERVRPMNSKPSCRAPSTSATSSGLGPWYLKSPSPVLSCPSTIKLWHTQMAVQKSITWCPRSSSLVLTCSLPRLARPRVSGGVLLSVRVSLSRLGELPPRFMASSQTPARRRMPAAECSRGAKAFRAASPFPSKSSSLKSPVPPYGTPLMATARMRISLLVRVPVLSENT
mmetsp:Transcript_7573/g.22358  ORF Transcript_7573/g.22358 Transcript_7573/m.22358 type:complete len:341 (-) Transcript_7573:1575-2597(-)